MRNPTNGKKLRLMHKADYTYEFRSGREERSLRVLTILLAIVVTCLIVASVVLLILLKKGST